jgi:hypothetical protein
LPSWRAIDRVAKNVFTGLLNRGPLIAQVQSGQDRYQKFPSFQATASSEENGLVGNDFPADNRRPDAVSPVQTKGMAAQARWD